jgi:hypothetical protein
MSLDDTLAAWAATVRLSPTAADDIYQRIVASPATAQAAVPAPLDPAWWRRFSSDFTTRMVASTKPVAWAA